jgi:hypothetical protein
VRRTIYEKRNFKEPKPLQKCSAENATRSIDTEQITDVTKKSSLYIQPTKCKTTLQFHYYRRLMLKASVAQSEQLNQAVTNLEKIKIETDIEKKNVVLNANFETDTGIAKIKGFKKERETTKASANCC